MRVFLKRFAAFLFFAPVGWMVLFGIVIAFPSLEPAFIARASNHGYVNRKTAEWTVLRDSIELDLALFGSSTCYVGIDPSAFAHLGIQAFNFGSSAQAIPHSHRLIQAYLSNNHPKALLLDVYPELWSKSFVGAEAPLDWIVNGNLWDLPWSIARIRMAFESRSPFAFMTLMFYPIKNSLWEPQDNDASVRGIYAGRGFVSRTLPRLQKTPRGEVLSVALSERDCIAMQSILNLCDANNVELILINPPQLIEESFKHPSCMQGITWIEGNDWPGAKIPSNYYDDHHLVGEGAQQYSQWLAVQIKQQAKSLR